ncbi:MAG: Rrf2 family transcriptional regulator [Phycisphaerales bacterium]|nr:Rrf2 family transcriptional regulator [Phycisphaerales bacterium]
MLTQTGEYALRAMVYMARKPGEGFCGVKEIAASTGVPANYLAKILQQLARSKVLDSQKGFGGGFRLNRPREEITLFDVIDPLERVEKFDQCVLGQRLCNDQVACPLHETWKAIRGQYLGSLHSTTLQDIADFRSKAELLDPKFTAPALSKR